MVGLIRLWYCVVFPEYGLEFIVLCMVNLLRCDMLWCGVVCHQFVVSCYFMILFAVVYGAVLW